MQPLVSVLIPTYNSAAYIERALNSAVRQTHRNLEVVVQDNASSDATFEIAAEHARSDRRISVERNQTNIGPWRNWQAALSRCSGDYIKVLWSDDWMEPTCIAECLQRLEQTLDAAVVFTGVIVHHAGYDDAFYLHPHITSLSTEEYLRATTLWRNMPVSPGAALVRTSAASFELPAGVSDSLKATAARTGAGADLFFLLNAALASERVLHVPKLLNHFQGRPDSLSGLYTSAVTEAYNESLSVCVGTVASKRFPHLPRQLRIARLKESMRGNVNRLISSVGRAVDRVSRGRQRSRSSV